MTSPYIFPFGQAVTTVDQKDTSPKKVFVLGVYASAVHAKWLSVEGKVVITALAAASEPYIFWRGDNAEKIISKIKIPKALGTLIPAAKNLNGPSGNALDDLFLTPLGVTRDNSWLCDLVPHSCLNPSQKAALEREYEPVQKMHRLPKVTLPPVPKILADDKRRAHGPRIGHGCLDRVTDDCMGWRRRCRWQRRLSSRYRWYLRSRLRHLDGHEHCRRAAGFLHAYCSVDR